LLDKAPVFLYMTEKEVSALAFSTLKGDFDHLGFTSRDEKAHRWCEDLFNHYWGRSEPLMLPVTRYLKRASEP
jgi:predicted transcriptional regulator